MNEILNLTCLEHIKHTKQVLNIIHNLRLFRNLSEPAFNSIAVPNEHIFDIITSNIYSFGTAIDSP